MGDVNAVEGKRRWEIAYLGKVRPPIRNGLFFRNQPFFIGGPDFYKCREKPSMAGKDK